MPDHLYAGLRNGEMNLIVFDKPQELRQLLPAIGLEVIGDVVKSGGHSVSCECCREPITVHNLGNVMPGSTLVYCKDPFCLTDYVAEHSDPRG